MSRAKRLSNIPRRRRERFYNEVRVSWNSTATRWRCSIRWFRRFFNHTMAGTRGDFIRRFHCYFYCFKKIIGNQCWISSLGCKWVGTDEHAANSSRKWQWNFLRKMESYGESGKNFVTSRFMCNGSASTVSFKCDILPSFSGGRDVVGLQQSIGKVRIYSEIMLN